MVSSSNHIRFGVVTGLALPLVVTGNAFFEPTIGTMYQVSGTVKLGIVYPYGSHSPSYNRNVDSVFMTPVAIIRSATLTEVLTYGLPEYQAVYDTTFWLYEP